MSKAFVLPVLAVLLMATATRGDARNDSSIDEKDSIQQMKASRQARREVRAAARKEQRDLFEAVPVEISAPITEQTTMGKAPTTMYEELVFMEQSCRQWEIIPIDKDVSPGDEVPGYQLGDYASFVCELYEFAVRYNTLGGTRVGDTFWGCRVIDFQGVVDVDPTARYTEELPVWDCTVNDYIGFIYGDVDSYLRNEGNIKFLSNPNGDRETEEWGMYYSHQGTFATVGGTGVGKGATGQMEVIYDMFQRTWLHIYNMEVWHKSVQRIHPYYPEHKDTFAGYKRYYNNQDGEPV